MTVLDWLRQFDPQAGNEELRGLLGQMLFSGEDGLKQTDALSGGEAARLLFCKLMLQKPNVLVLDEPTNHLDLESINALNIALQKYPGTVFLVTHDHDLIEEMATRIWHFEHGKIEDFKGAYEEYVALRLSFTTGPGIAPARLSPVAHASGHPASRRPDGATFSQPLLKSAGGRRFPCSSDLGK